MGNHAVMALVGGGRRHHDHLALGLGQPAVLFHQRVMIGKEGAKFVRTISQRQEDVRDEAGFFLHREDPGADVLRQPVDGGRLKSFGRGLAHERVPA